MGRALLIIGWMSTAGFVANGIVGLRLLPDESLSFHILFGVASALLLLFSHCWIMFYLIGTGKAIKVAVAEHDLDPHFVQLTKDFKNESYPWMMLAMGLAMAAFIVGAGVHTRVIPAFVHLSLYILTILAQIRTLWIEQRVLGRNSDLMAQISGLIASPGSTQPAPGEGESLPPAGEQGDRGRGG